MGKQLYLALLFSVLWLAAIECRSNNSRILPNVLKRRVDDWNRNNSCNYQRIKVNTAEVMLSKEKNETFYLLRTNVVNDGFELKKIEMMLEIGGISAKKARSRPKRKYTAAIQSSFNNSTISNVSSSAIYIKNNRWEITFDMTALYKISNSSFHNTTLKIKLLRNKNKPAKFLMRPNMKAYFLLYQTTETCSLSDFFKYDPRFQTSIEDLRPKSVLKSAPSRNYNTQLCGVKPSIINFYDIGLHFITYPEEFNIGMCSGICPITNPKTGYQFMRNLSIRNPGVQSVECRPTEYGSMTLIYGDSTDKTIVMSKFVDTTVIQCGCH